MGDRSCHGIASSRETVAKSVTHVSGLFRYRCLRTEPLWVAKLQAVGNANPISYRVRNGKQHVAIVATDQVVVFTPARGPRN